MRAAILVALVAAAVILFVVLKGNDSGSSSTSTTAEKPLVITVGKNGRPAGGVQKLTVNKGDRIRFTVDSAVSDEVHLHGYDVPKGVRAGGSVSFDLPATLEGEFEAELESRHEQILELTVNP